ncbi:spidroin-2 [Folsomia candida]|uniref:spidroin-2 n=1 Tax=Folsomia candida TaxID=158441 RepID=UPI000B8FD531|nr:spidroin-2 [Folsomia candida]
MKGAILILGGSLLLLGCAHAGGGGAGASGGNVGNGGGEYTTSPLFSFQVGDVGDDAYGSGPSKPKGFLASLFSGLTGGGFRGRGAGFGGGHSGGVGSPGSYSAGPSGSSSSSSGEGGSGRPSDNPLGPGADPGPLNYPSIMSSSSSNNNAQQPQQPNALLLTSQGSSSGLSVPGGLRPSSPSNNILGSSVSQSISSGGAGGPQSSFSSVPGPSSSSSSAGQMSSFVGTGPGGDATINDIFGPSEGYKPGPPPGFGGGRPFRRGPPRPRFPAMFSWGDASPPRRPPPAKQLHQPLHSYKGAASESIPVRIGSAIMGLFGGGQQPQQQQRPQQAQDAASFSNYYSVPPQANVSPQVTSSFSSPSSPSSPVSSGIQGQASQFLPQQSAPTLASQPGLPFPSLVQTYQRGPPHNHYQSPPPRHAYY